MLPIPYSSASILAQSGVFTVNERGASAKAWSKESLVGLFRDAAGVENRAPGRGDEVLAADTDSALHSGGAAWPLLLSFLLMGVFVRVSFFFKKK